MSHHLELCISSGKWVGEELAVFAFNEDEVAVVLGPDHSLDMHRLLRHRSPKAGCSWRQ
ncbi:hypothetical protein [Ilumatobacter sp.]|uniref:hypothetical protein n=1 Tax=Ilumatobacter sp. TaxID=1967498 RepID=UPI003751EC3A